MTSETTQPRDRLTEQLTALATDAAAAIQHAGARLVAAGALTSIMQGNRDTAVGMVAAMTPDQRQEMITAASELIDVACRADPPPDTDGPATPAQLAALTAGSAFRRAYVGDDEGARRYVESMSIADMQDAIRASYALTSTIVDAMPGDTAPQAPDVEYRCPGCVPGSDRQGAKVVHSAGCCAGFATLPADQKAATGLRHPAVAPQATP